ncbi:MAG: DNA-formamidopyrimidine glycosylase [Elainellaceae cyanobacterium]
MPELPEVETVRRGLNRVTLNQPFSGGDVLLPRTIAHPDPAAFAPSLTGCCLTQWQRRGKYLLAALAQDGQPAGWLGVHLRMTGQLLWVDPTKPVSSHCRVRLFFDSGQELRFVDQRTFGQMWRVPKDMPPESIITGLQRLGPEPLSDAFSLDYLKRSLQHRRRPIKNALLDQALIAGIGNIYADESLFLSKILPTTHCDRLTHKQFTRLHQQIIDVLTNSIGAGGTTFSDFRDVHGVNGNYGEMAWVYGREGQDCRVCGEVIQRLKLGGRSTFFCDRCQG